MKKNDKPTPTLPDKPVECTICSRKFKNIPALNGHMRLHGGYYKKDADGRRLVGKSIIICLKNLGQVNLLIVLGTGCFTSSGTWNGGFSSFFCQIFQIEEGIRS